MNENVKTIDREVTIKLKMSEANFIISALAGVKFRADGLIQNIVDQGNVQLPKPTSEMPIGISEEMDEKIIGLFSYEDHAAGQLEFDFNKPGHVVVACKFDGDKADELVKSITASGINEQVTVTVNREIEGATIFVFSLPATEDSAPASEENALDEDSIVFDGETGSFEKASQSSVKKGK